MMISSNNAQLSTNLRANAAPRAKETAEPAAAQASTDQVELGTQSSEITRHQIPGSFIVIADSNRLASLESNPSVQVERVLGSAGESTFLLVNSPEASLDQLQADSTFSQVLPNYQYEGKLYDEPVSSDSPLDAAPTGRPGHLDIINIDPAWAVTKGSPNVISAITDTGLDTSHPELKDTFWINPKEVAGNGKDDDNNGLVDDINGWDFTDNDNSSHDNVAHHHTHVHGIVHAHEGNSGATGIAPEAKGMALRIAGGRRPYSSAVVAESYLYAMNQGAKSVNTSFNIDGFPGDKAIENTYRALADNDVLIFNSAGNNGAKDSARSAFEDIILVAATETAAATVDKKASFSNYGIGVDIAAPGKDIYSTLPNGKVGPLSGTSMASPVAMSMDLLVQSAHPDWTGAQRWAQIAGTADKIDATNPDLVGQLGAGRVNAGRALTETLAAPTISVKETKGANGGTSKLTVRFDKVLDPKSANDQKSWSVLNEQGETVMQGAPKEVRLMTNQLDFNVSKLPAGSYTLVGSSEHLHDPFGQALDGDKDGKAGGDHVTKFEVK